MHAAADRPEFAPPPQDNLRRGLGYALVAHALLAVGLSGAVKWQRESPDTVVEAELWSALPQQAAPQQVAPPPAPEPQPVVTAPPPPPVVKAPPLPEPPAQREADIALEREKQQRELEKIRQAELERERQEQRRREEARKQREEELAKKQREEELAKKKREEELAKKKQEQARLLAEARRKEEEERKRKEQEAREEKRLAQQREDHLRRMQAMAGTDAPSSSGTAAQASGPSAGWGARVQARVRPNIVFTDAVSGNPKAEVEVRTAPDGTIVARKLVRSSGVKAWDEAVLRALDKTETLPRDVDGRVPSPVVIEFRLRG